MNQLPNSAYGVMKLLPDTKQGVEIFSNQLVSAVENGEVNPLQLKALFKIMEKVAEKVDGKIKENLLREAGKWSEKTFHAYGFEIEKTEVGAKYDYLSCGDPIYEQRHAIWKAAEEQLKERAEFLKALRESVTLVDDESGEVATIHPPVKRSTEGLKFTMK
jgi:hypothetical protein